MNRQASTRTTANDYGGTYIERFRSVELEKRQATKGLNNERESEDIEKS